MSVAPAEQGGRARSVGYILNTLELRRTKATELELKMCELAYTASEIAKAGSWSVQCPRKISGVILSDTLHGTKFVRVGENKAIAVREATRRIEEGVDDECVVTEFFVRKDGRDPVRLATFDTDEWVVLDKLGKPTDMETLEGISALLEYIGASDQK